MTGDSPVLFLYKKNNQRRKTQMGNIKKYEELLKDFKEIYSSEPNKLIDHLLGELTCAISEDFWNQFINYCNEKGVEVDNDNGEMDELCNGEFDISEIFTINLP